MALREDKKIRTVGDQKGDDLPRGEEIITRSPPHLLAFMAALIIMFSSSNIEDIEKNPYKEEI